MLQLHTINTVYNIHTINHHSRDHSQAMVAAVINLELSVVAATNLQP